MREAALYISWGRVVTGREKIALDLFGRALTFLQSEVGKGTLRDLNLYGFKGDSSTYAFLLAHGGEDDIERLQKTEEFMKIQLQIGRVVEDVRIHIVLGGELEQAREVERMREAWTEIGIL